MLRNNVERIGGVKPAYVSIDAIECDYSEPELAFSEKGLSFITTMNNQEEVKSTTMYGVKILDENLIRLENEITPSHYVGFGFAEGLIIGSMF